MYKLVRTSLLPLLTVLLLSACGGSDAPAVNNNPTVSENITTLTASLSTLFSGTQDGVDFNSIRNTPTQFTLGDNLLTANFTGMVLHVMQTGMYIAPSPNAWGIGSNGDATINFSNPVNFVSGKVRGTDASVGFMDANATLTAMDKVGNTIGTMNVPNNSFVAFSFAGEIAQLVLSNNATGSMAVIGELHVESGTVATTFAATQDGTVFNNIRGTASDFTLGSEPFSARYQGMVLHAMIKPLYVTPSPNAWGVNGMGLASIDFSSPASIVTGQVRGTNATMPGMADANATLKALDVNNIEIASMVVPNDQFARFVFHGPVARLVLENTAAGSMALIGEIRSRASSVVTRFDTNNTNFPFVDLVNTMMPFRLGTSAFNTQFNGMLMHVNIGPLYVAPSMNSWGVNGSGNAEVIFSAMTSYITTAMRGSNTALVGADANAQLEIFDAQDNSLGAVNINNDMFEYAIFQNGAKKMVMSNTADNSMAVIGEIAAEAGLLNTIFFGTQSNVTFNNIQNQPSIFTLSTGEYDAVFDGAIYHVMLPGMYIAPSPNAWGLNGQGSATITFSTTVNFVAAQVRGSNSGIPGLGDADAKITAFDENDNAVAVYTLSNAGFEWFMFSGPIKRLELNNAAAGSMAVLGQLTVIGGR